MTATIRKCGCGEALDVRGVLVPGTGPVEVGACHSCDRPRCRFCQRPFGELFGRFGHRKCENCGRVQ